MDQQLDVLFGVVDLERACQRFRRPKTRFSRAAQICLSLTFGMWKPSMRLSMSSPFIEAID
jgi:hypothetical protein